MGADRMPTGASATEAPQAQDPVRIDAETMHAVHSSGIEPCALRCQAATWVARRQTGGSSPTPECKAS